MTELVMTSWQALVFSGWAVRRGHGNTVPADDQRISGKFGNNDIMASDLTGMRGVDGTAFEAFSMRELTAATFDEGLLAAGDGLAVVFFWGVDCFNCEVAKKTMLSQREAIEALDLRWFHANVYADMALGRRFALHGVPTFFFFHHGKKLGRATGWQGLPQFRLAVAAAREKIAAAGGKTGPQEGS